MCERDRSCDSFPTCSLSGSNALDDASHRQAHRERSGAPVRDEIGDVQETSSSTCTACHGEPSSHTVELNRIASPRMDAHMCTSDTEHSADVSTTRSLGCRHYRRAVLLKAPCCGVFVPCRRCHDEGVENGQLNCSVEVMDRFAVETLKCMRCNEEQPVADTCRNPACGERFAKYACLTCRLFEDRNVENIYHCNKCGICRAGKREDNFHCDTCNACIARNTLSEHRCLAGALEGDCPVCVKPLFSSTTPVIFLPCGHTLHKSCFEHLTKRDYRCCICRKAMIDMSATYARLREMLRAELDGMPDEHRNRTVKVLCNDCGQKSTTAFHFDLHMCTATTTNNAGEARECGSFNTSLLSD